MFISAVLNPMDVVKVRLQTQNQLSLKSQGGMYHADAEYTGFRQALVKIWRQEGFARGLMKGFTPSMLREASYSSLRMGLYDQCKALVAPNAKDKDEFTLLQKIAAGMLSGAIGASIANPTDLIKIRFQRATPENPHGYKHTAHAFSSIYTNEGFFTGLYKGVLPTVARGMTLTGSQLASYDHTKRMLLHTGYFQDSPSTHLLASFVSGLVTTTACNPFDVVKTRIMTDSDKMYRGPFDCFVKTVRHEGPLALMKGWVPNYCRLGPHFLVSIPLMELIRKSMGADSM